MEIDDDTETDESDDESTDSAEEGPNGHECVPSV